MLLVTLLNLRDLASLVSGWRNYLCSGAGLGNLLVLIRDRARRGEAGPTLTSTQAGAR